MIANVLLLIVGFALLVKGADYLIDGSVAIARRFGVSELFIGLTIVAFGTSAPELAVSVKAAIDGSGIAIGNVLGSNVANVALILGATAIIQPLRISTSTIAKEMPFVILSTIAAGMLLLNGTMGLNRYDGVVLLCFFAIFVDYLFSMAKNDREIGITEEKGISHLEHKMPLAIFATLGGLAGVVFGSDLVVNSGINLARSFGVSDTLIGVTLVAFGTSLPELVTSITAGIKKKADLAVGNIIGSNIFNLLLVLGISSSISPIQTDRDITQDIIFALISIVLLLLFSGLKRKKLGRTGGIILLAFYFIYIYLSLKAG
ncbi:MAG: calcium/sodium antiporter [Kosmotoga sp.]|uniref:calcium/sodium antiporter n=1 Tax=Kosmotoga sp. TaxID=1955248 RepID=UPI001D59BB14|nr:calcium/sodium antiporter [Kosmotoga sp.]MBO8166347.1 calcium/sodium antiporter [Kosmotoga sp.]